MDKLLENNMLVLRAIEPEDLELLYKWENDTDVWKYGAAISPYSKHILRQYIIDAQTDIYQSKQLRFMISLKEQGVTVGTIDLYDFDAINSRCGVGIYIDTKYRGNKYAKYSLNILEKYVFNFLNINQLYAVIPEKNNPSIKLFLSSHYIQAGVLKEWIAFDSGYEEAIIVQKLKSNEK